MQPSSGEMEAINTMTAAAACINERQQESNPQITPFESTTNSTTPWHDDFLEQMFSTIPNCSTWPELSSSPNTNDHGTDAASVQYPSFDDSTLLESKLRHHQINGAAAVKSFLLQQQLLLSRGVNRGGGGGEAAGILSLPLSLANVDSVDSGLLIDGSPHDVVPPAQDALYNGFAGSLHGNGQTAFHHSQAAQNFSRAAQATATGAAAMNLAQGSGSTGGGSGPAPQKQRVRARRGQATDPHSIAERLRRERIAERMKALQELVPSANKAEKASMLDEIIDYVKFLQLQVKVLSMSRLGGAVAPLAADMSSEAAGGPGRSSSGTQTAAAAAAAAAEPSNDNLTVTEHQVAKLMEEDMASAMQYLQGKGLCLMPISLATAISTATCHTRQAHNSKTNNHHHHQHNATNNGVSGSRNIYQGLLGSNVEGPNSPSLSVLTAQSAGGGGDGDGGLVKDATYVSKP
ncbi:hypothetical protein Ancab_035070 [Ancistrocladus abbreviatus]